MKEDGEEFKYLSEKFVSSHSEVNINADVFNGPEICPLICDEIFQEKINPVENSNWETFGSPVKKKVGK